MKLYFLAAVGAAHLLRRAPPIDLTVDEAKNFVPVAVKSAFAEAMSTKDSAAVLSSMGELSELYSSAQGDLDESTIACKNHKQRFRKDVEAARLAWQQLQSQVTLTMSRMATAQAGVARAETEIETYRNHHVSLTKTCSSKQADANACSRRSTGTCRWPRPSSGRPWPAAAPAARPPRSSPARWTGTSTRPSRTTRSGTS
jgi:hypothetical protein